MKVAEVVKLAEVKVYETKSQAVEDTFGETYNETYIDRNSPSILQKCEEDEIVENCFASNEDDELSLYKA